MIKPYAQLAKGGPFLNFAYFSMQFCKPGDLKGGPWHNGPPKYAPDHTIVTKNNFECLIYDYLLYFNVYVTHLLTFAFFFDLEYSR